MQVIETDPKIFLEIHPPLYPQFQFLLNNALNNIIEKSGKLFALKDNGSFLGRIITFADPDHKSYNKKVGSFGWIFARRPEYLPLLLEEAEYHLKSQGMAVIRGPRNDPVVFGGQGVLVHGFDQPELFGVPVNAPWSSAILRKCGYECDTQYYCIRWTAPFPHWTDKEDPEIRLIHLAPNEIMDRAEEIIKLYNNCMANYPDVTELNRKTLENSIYFLKLIKAEHFLFFATCNDKIIGLSVLIPNIFDLWDGRSIQNSNWYIADIYKEYRGRFVFSKITNRALELLRENSIPAYEGTYIWDQNKSVTEMCLRTGKMVRRHLVYSKKLNGGIEYGVN